MLFSFWWSEVCFFFVFKHKTAYEMRISDWSSDGCSSDLHHEGMDPHDLASHISPVATAADILAARPLIDAVRVEPPVIAYLVALARATRESPSLSLGVSPRGTAMLLHAAKAWTWLIGRDFVTPDEVKAMAQPALRPRIALRDRKSTSLKSSH